VERLGDGVLVFGEVAIERVEVAVDQVGHTNAAAGNLVLVCRADAA
jgi:homoserine acetyltransferase